MSYNQEDRKFLHDLATPLTVLRMVVTTLTKELSGEKPSRGTAGHVELLKKAIGALEKAEALHADQKSKIHEREQKV